MRLLFIVIAITLAAPALAQGNPQQTPANATAFLDRLAKTTGYRVAIYRYDRVRGIEGWNVRALNGRRHVWDDYVVTGYHVREGCQAAFGFNAGPRQQDGANEFDGPQGGWADDAREEGWRGQGMWVDWTKVSAIKQEDAVVRLTLPHGDFTGDLRLSFASPDLAARATLALEVIRQGCDPTAGMGF